MRCKYIYNNVRFRVGGERVMRNCCRKLLLIIQIVLIPALLLSGCADLKISKALVQHAVGGIYDPTDQIAEDQLNAILEAAVAQDAAAIKAQFAPNAVAAQPELDDQIEALLDYLGDRQPRMHDYGFFKCRWDGWSDQLLPDARNDFNRSILSFFLARYFSGHKKSRQCRHLGIVPAPSGSAYGLCVLCGW